MDIFDRLKTDHDRQRALAARLMAAPEGTAEQYRLFDLLCDAVEAYGAAAEQTLYAELLAGIQDERFARRAVDAHDEAARLIAELSDRAMSGEEWRAGLAQLADHLERTYSMEEGETFAAARSLIAGERATVLGDGFERAATEWIAVFGRQPAEQPVPAAPARTRVHAARQSARASMRGRASTWLQRFRPLRGGKVAHPIAALSTVAGSPAATRAARAGKPFRRSRGL